VTAGLVGFLVILALVVAAVFLFRSMTKHMRRVPERFDAADDNVADDATERGQSSGRD
jgi:O-antigen ligase